jgi:hypothetical protein
MTEEIFVPLLDEGVAVWRPVQAEKVDDETYLIPAHYDPAQAAEHWEYPPGSTVICRRRQSGDRAILVAVALAASGRRAAS